MSDTRIRHDVPTASEAGLGDAVPTTPGATRCSAPQTTTAPARTPADPTPVPETADRHDLSRPEYYLNRELTWLNFNFRVLHEAEDPRTPVLERLKFLAIVGSNLDEFFMKRIGGLKQQVEAGITERTVDGRTPGEQIEQCYTVVRELETGQRKAGADSPEGTLAGRGDPGNRRLEASSNRETPQVAPQTLRAQHLPPGHPPGDRSGSSLPLHIQPVAQPAGHPALQRATSTRLWQARQGTGGRRHPALRHGLRSPSEWVPLESVMANNLDLLFPGMEILACEIFRVTRNAIYDL